jgi:hypothetical protein
VIGRAYLLRGEPVVVLARWETALAVRLPDSVRLYRDDDLAAESFDTRAAPRNVLVEFADGTRTVRPFRGLRKP